MYSHLKQLLGNGNFKRGLVGALRVGTPGLLAFLLYYMLEVLRKLDQILDLLHRTGAYPR